MSASCAPEARGRLADQLGLTPDALAELASRAEQLYYRFPLPKRSGGCRWIEAPRAELRRVQRRLLTRVLYQLSPHPAAHGFVPGRSIVTNARAHAHQSWVACFDIAAFFPSVAREQVQELLQGRLQLEADEVQRVLDLTCRHRALPQGAPTSPHLANLAFRPVDELLEAFAAGSGLRYTRYADDLTFSGDRLPPGMEAAVAAAAASAGFQLAPGKTRFLPRHRQQRVTGLVVNDGVALPRRTRRWLRAALHRRSMPGDLPEGLYPDTPGEEQLMGYLALARMCSAG